MQNNKQIYRAYRYIIVGSRGVGKTNIITRFLRDEFIQNHNLVLEGEQKVIFTIQQTKFKLLLEDQNNVDDLAKLPVRFLQEADGLMFVFSFDSQESFENLEKQLDYFNETIKPYMGSVSRRLATLMVGNKSDLATPLLQMGQNAGQLTFCTKTSLHERARQLSLKMSINYHEVSTKCSSREQIEQLFVQLINQNEIYKFCNTRQREQSSLLRKLTPRLPCCSSEDSQCFIY